MTDIEHSLFEESVSEAPPSSPEGGSSGKKSCFWWPSDFWDEQDDVQNCPNASFAEADGSPKHEGAEKDLLHNLRYAYQLVSYQSDRIAQLSEEVEQLEHAVSAAQRDAARFKKNCRRTAQAVCAVLALTALSLWHREIGQVGWNLFQGAAGILNCSPQQMVGLLTAAVLVRLFWKLAKAIFSAALEELIPNKESVSLDEEEFL